MLSEILNEETWIKGNSSADSQGNFVYIDSPNATKFDVYGALKYFYYGDRLEKAIAKFKVAYRAIYPKLYERAATTYEVDGKVCKVYPTYKLNDLLDNFSQLSRILAITDV